MDEFAFSLGNTVTITTSGETGIVIGRAQYSYAEPSYLIRYKCGDGRAIESWWTQGALARVYTEEESRAHLAA